MNWDEIRTREGTITADDTVYLYGGWSSKSTIDDAEARRIAYARV